MAHRRSPRLRRGQTGEDTQRIAIAHSGRVPGLPQEVMKTDLERFGELERNGKILHRFRLGDYRVYFERHELEIVVHRILNRNSLKDFLFRSSLPTGDDEALQENPKFWELIETAKASSK